MKMKYEYVFETASLKISTAYKRHFDLKKWIPIEFV
jgi:hypothetical protein